MSTHFSSQPSFKERPVILSTSCMDSSSTTMPETAMAVNTPPITQNKTDEGESGPSAMENMPATPAAATNSMGQFRPTKLAFNLLTIAFSLLSFLLMSSDWLTNVNTTVAAVITTMNALVISIIFYFQARELYRRLS